VDPRSLAPAGHPRGVGPPGASDHLPALWEIEIEAQRASRGFAGAFRPLHRHCAPRHLLLQGQLYDRGFLYFVLAGTILVSFVILQRQTDLRKLAAILLSLAAVTACSSLFYQDSLMTVSTQSRAMSDFIDERMSFDSWVVGGSYPDIVWKESNWTSFIRASTTWSTTTPLIIGPARTVPLA